MIVELRRLHLLKHAVSEVKKYFAQLGSDEDFPMAKKVRALFVRDCKKQKDLV